MTPTSPLDRFSAPPQERPTGARCDNTVPADAVWLVGPDAWRDELAELRAAWARGERSEFMRERGLVLAALVQSAEGREA